MYDNVLELLPEDSSLFSTGGDATLKPADAKANRFKPVVKFIGPFYLGKGKSQTHTLKLPMYVGSVRAMVVAGQDGAYGNTEKTAFVRTPLMMLSTLPRVRRYSGRNYRSGQYLCDGVSSEECNRIPSRHPVEEYRL